VWIAAGGVYTGRLVSAERTARHQLAAVAPTLETAIRERRDLAEARNALGELARAVEGRSRASAILAELTRVLKDSVYLDGLRWSPDSIQVTGYAPGAEAVMRVLQRSAAFELVRQEGVPTRQMVGEGAEARELDHFTIAAKVKRP
jgi:Tfp pilus assembly protein PilN